MALIDEVTTMCRRLAPAGWASMLRHHGLDIEAPDLAAEYARQLEAVDRSAPGFEHFAPNGCRGVEPGDPAASLLYPRPGLSRRGGRPRRCSAARLSHPRRARPRRELRLRCSPLVAGRSVGRGRRRSGCPGCVRFGVPQRSRYAPRPARRCVPVPHCQARVGTAEAHYEPQQRGFVPFAEDPHLLRCPALSLRRLRHPPATGAGQVNRSTPGSG